MTKQEIANGDYVNGLLTGMFLAKNIHRKNKLSGGKKFDFKKALAIMAGPIGWAILANKNAKENKELKKQLEIQKKLITTNETPATEQKLTETITDYKPEKKKKTSEPDNEMYDEALFKEVMSEMK